MQVCQAVGVVWRSLSHVSTIFCGRDTPSGLRCESGLTPRLLGLGIQAFSDIIILPFVSPPAPPLLLKVLQEFAAGKQTGVGEVVVFCIYCRIREQSPLR